MRMQKQTQLKRVALLHNANKSETQVKLQQKFSENTPKNTLKHSEHTEKGRWRWCVNCRRKKNKQTIYIPSDTAFSSCNKENYSKENKYVEVWCNLRQKWKKAGRSEKNAIPLTIWPNKSDRGVFCSRVFCASNLYFRHNVLHRISEFNSQNNGIKQTKSARGLAWSKKKWSGLRAVSEWGRYV